MRNTHDKVINYDTTIAITFHFASEYQKNKLIYTKKLNTYEVSNFWVCYFEVYINTFD